MALKVAGILDDGFHMSEFNAGWGPYKDWSKQKRDSLYEALLQAINKHTMFGFSAAVRKDDYDELVIDRLREKLGGHYRFVVSACMWEIQPMLRGGPFHAPEPIRYVFAHGTKGNGEVNSLFGELAEFREVRENYGIRCARIQPEVKMSH